MIRPLIVIGSDLLTLKDESRSFYYLAAYIPNLVFPIPDLFPWPCFLIFVQHTEYSEMVKRMRRKLDTLENLGNIKVKLVERAGEKLVNSLHKSNAWSERDCERNDCMICKTEGCKKGSCRRRNILYETFCITCSKLKAENERKFEEILKEVNNKKEMKVDRERESNEEIDKELILVEIQYREEERERASYSSMLEKIIEVGIRE